MSFPNDSPERHPSDDPFGTIKLSEAFMKFAEALAQLNGVDPGVIEGEDQLNNQEDVVPRN